MSLFDSFRDPDLCKGLLRHLDQECSELKFMEVCGTHTVSIFQSGLHSLLPEGITHLTGPGCPVCVTHDAEVDAYLRVAAMDNVILATFGDLMKVPGPGGLNLKTAQAEGARTKVVYSPFDALGLAEENPDDTVVFIGVGFETTAPAIAATVKTAKQKGLHNFKVLSFHKLVPPALRVLLDDPDMNIEAFILPGHVSAVIGLEPYTFLREEYKLPAVVGGFEPSDILQSLLMLVRMKNSGKPDVANQYTRVVSDQGNPTAIAVMEEVFSPSDALWRGIGTIPGSGLVFSEAYREFDALEALGLELNDVQPIKGCMCGEVLKGKMRPNQCPLFRKACTPAKPVGPCMVSTEGSCAAYYKYSTD